MPRKECDAVKERLEAVLTADGAVLDESLEAHVAACDDCAEAMVSGLEATPAGRLATAPPPAASPTPVSRLRLPRRVRLLAGLSRQRWMGVGWVALVVLLDAFAGLYYFPANGWPAWHGVEPLGAAAEQALRKEQLVTALGRGFERLASSVSTARVLDLLHGHLRENEACTTTTHPHVDQAGSTGSPAEHACLASRLAADTRPSRDDRSGAVPREILEMGLRDAFATVRHTESGDELVALTYLLDTFAGSTDWLDRQEKAVYLLQILEECDGLSQPLHFDIRRRLATAAGLGDRSESCTDGSAEYLVSRQSGWSHCENGQCYYHGYSGIEDQHAPRAATYTLYHLQHVLHEDGYHACLVAMLDPGAWSGTVTIALLALGFVAHAMALGHLAWLVMVILLFRRNLVGAVEADPVGGVRAWRGLFAALAPVVLGLSGVLGGFLWWVGMGILHQFEEGFPVEMPGGGVVSVARLGDILWPTVFSGGEWSASGTDLLRLALLAALGSLVAVILVDGRARLEGGSLRPGRILFPLIAVILVTPGSWVGTGGHLACAVLFLLAATLRRIMPSTSFDERDRRRLGDVMASCLAIELAQLAALPALGDMSVPFERLWADGMIMITAIVAPVLTGFVIAHLPAGQSALARRLTGNALLLPALALGPRLVMMAVGGGLPVRPVLDSGPTGVGPALCGSYLAAAGGALITMVFLGLVLGFRLAPEGAGAYAGPPADECWPRLVASVIRAGWAFRVSLVFWAVVGAATFLRLYLATLPELPP